MFDGLMKMIKGMSKRPELIASSKDTAKERLHLVLMQDRANVSVDFLDMMKQEIIDVIKKYIEIDENSIDVRLTNKPNADGSNGAPALYANIPILDIKEEIIEQMEMGKIETKKSQAPKTNTVKKVDNTNNSNKQTTNANTQTVHKNNNQNQSGKTQNKSNNNKGTNNSNKSKKKRTNRK